MLDLGHTDQKALGCIWQDFIEGKINKNPGIRQEVFDSWRRSKQWGVDPYMEKAPVVLTGSALTEELERKNAFLSVATPVIEDFYSAIKGTKSGFWICNENGIVIKCVTDPDLEEECKEHNLVVGADWSEKKIGTNAMGTALVLRRMIQLLQTEHYLKMAQIGFCAAAPIIGPNGEVMGALNVTAPPDKAHPHTLGMVVAGVGAIQREMRLHSSHQYIMETIESLPSGIIVVNQNGTIANINRKACDMLKSPLDAFLMKNIYETTLSRIDCIQKALESGKVTEEREYYFESGTQKLHFTVTCRPITNRVGFPDGAVVILREIEAILRMTGRMAGYKARFTFNDIVGEDAAFKEVTHRAEAAALTPVNILIQGESGTGKEVLAQSIHNASERRRGPFVAINCGAIPRELIGSELFGYEEGAFTGAKRRGSPGKFELASNGTLFLDEIGDMPMDLQLMLLRVIQERVVTRLGGQREVSVNVRLITATNKNLRRLVSEGLFRSDLYYRLNVVNFQIPPLRQRKADIAILANHIIKTHSEKVGKAVVALSPQSLKELENYSWPGNVRELENVLERALIFSDGSDLQIDSLSTLINPEKVYDDSDENKSSPLSSEKGDEKDLIIKTLALCKGSISRTAGALSMSRQTLYRKLRDYNIKKNWAS